MHNYIHTVGKHFATYKPCVVAVRETANSSATKLITFIHYICAHVHI